MKLFNIVLQLLLFAIPISSQLPSKEILELLEFKKGITHDPTGYILDSWSEESIDFNGCPSSWNGILCSGRSVVGVVLNNLGLSGTVDLSVFTNLTMLTKLSLSNNNISGQLPGNVGDFASLRYLDLSDNLLSGELPGGFGQLRGLQNISLAGNNFSGPIPDSIGGLASILSLDLSRNLISDPLPSALKELRNLVSLNLSYNAFTGKIPTGLEQLPDLQSLDLSWNRLDGSIDWKFLTQSSVVHVDLSGNLLTNSGEKELKFLSEISETVKYLNLSNNRLTGSLIDAPELSTFGSLKALDLSYNQLSGELPRFDYVYDLEVLRLRNNVFAGVVPNVLLKGDSMVLSELDLSANNLSGHVGLIISSTLRTLNLSSNAISGGIPLLTGSCTILDLSRNQFTGNLSLTTKWGDDMEYIDISRNQLTGPIPQEISQFLRLNYLNLSHNALTSTLPKVLAQYPKLSVLDLSFNQFGGPIIADLLTSSTLQELYLKDNSLEGGIVFSNVLPTESKLRVLDVSRNRFSGNFADAITSLTGLQVLDLSANNFSGLFPPDIAKLTSLTSIDMSINHFTGPLPASLPDTLLRFNASYNDLSGVVPENLRNFPDSSFHPGNSRLQFPNGPRGGPSHKRRKTWIRTVIIAACVVAVVILILLVIFVHYRTVSRRSRSEKVLDRSAQRRSLSETGVGGSSIVSADDLMASRKGSSFVTINPEENVAVVSGSSPSKNSLFSWSPDLGERFSQERLDFQSPDTFGGELCFLDETITLTPEELSRAPAEVLGRSGHGTSYRATLDNGVLLTVKWLREGMAKPKKELAKEAKKFANIKHPNVVGLRGYYWGPSQHENLILSDYVSPGSLAAFLYDRPGRRGPPLTWAQRLKIAADIARGLNYLHLDRALPHGNLKATNVLLDGLDLNARVADYCLHRLTTRPGTTERILDSAMLGYRAPELAGPKKPCPTFKADVYAFGVVLMELLTGRCAGDIVSGDEGGVALTQWVRLRAVEGRGSECFDADMAADSLNPVAAGGMKGMLGIALRCVCPVSERPGIKSVYEDLSSI